MAVETSSIQETWNVQNMVFLFCVPPPLPPTPLPLEKAHGPCTHASVQTCGCVGVLWYVRVALASMRWYSSTTQDMQTHQMYTLTSVKESNLQYIRKFVNLLQQSIYHQPRLVDKTDMTTRVHL